MYLGELDRPRGILDELQATAGARGDEGTRAMALWWLSVLEWLAGRWQFALGHSLTAYELAEQTQHAHARVWAGRAKALVEADLGLVDDARATVEEALAVARESSNEVYAIFGLGVLGRLELALGDLHAAGAHLRELPRRLLDGGLKDPSSPIWADAIETLVTLGELEQARAYLAAYEANAGRLGQPLGDGRGFAVSRPVRGCGGARRPVRSTRSRRSLSELVRHPYPLERGRTLLCLGVGPPAGAAEEGCRARGARAGARDLRGAGCAALGREGSRGAPAHQRPRSRVGRADRNRAAGRRARSGGRTNKEIAAELYMGVSTVEAHLSHVYRKLSPRLPGAYEANAGRLGSPWAIASSSRCRGLFEAADGHVDRAIDAFETSLSELERHPYPLEQGRTLLCLGVVRRQAQQKRAAREALQSCSRLRGAGRAAVGGEGPRGAPTHQRPCTRLGRTDRD